MTIERIQSIAFCRFLAYGFHFNSKHVWLKHVANSSECKLLSLSIMIRLFRVLYFSVRSWMPIIEFNGPLTWSPDVSETWNHTKYQWVGVVGDTASRKNRKTVTVSLWLVFKGHGWFMAPLLIKSIPWRKHLSELGNILITCHYEGLNNEDNKNKMSRLNAE